MQQGNLAERRRLIAQLKLVEKVLYGVAAVMVGCLAYQLAKNWMERGGREDLPSAMPVALMALGVLVAMWTLGKHLQHRIVKLESSTDEGASGARK